jgi:hypothetical protein
LLVHLAGLGPQVLIEWNLKIKKFIPVGVAQLMQVQLGTFERVVEL